MDFTFIFLIIIMLLAAKQGIFLLAVALLVLAFITAKNRYALYGAIVGALLLGAVYLGIFKETGPELIIGGLFIIFLISVKGDEGQQTPYGAGYPGMPGY